MSEEEIYTGEFKIKNVVGKNLLETYEVNGRKYTDNLPKNAFINIPKKQYIEYEQQKEEIERLNNKEEQLIRRLEDLIIVGEQVENEWAVDICKMIIKELKGSDKE